VCTFSVLADVEGALEALREYVRVHVDRRFPGHFWFDRDPDLVNIRSDPRYRDIVWTG
jgi:hypothetical protein